jgi:hypothetical protein
MNQFRVDQIVRCARDRLMLGWPGIVQKIDAHRCFVDHTPYQIEDDMDEITCAWYDAHNLEAFALTPEEWHDKDRVPLHTHCGFALHVPMTQPVTPEQVQASIQAALKPKPLTREGIKKRNGYMNTLNALLKSGKDYPFEWTITDDEAGLFDARAFDAAIAAYQAYYNTSVVKEDIPSNWHDGPTTKYHVTINKRDLDAQPS